MSGSLAARTLARPSFEAAFAAPAFLRAMLAFESALAEAEAAEGAIPAASAAAIATACARVDIDVEELVREAKRSATLAVPLVKALVAEVSLVSQPAAMHVHFGATSQDVLDTAMALCLKSCLEEADRELETAVRALVRRARETRATPMLGRTLMQPALPITAGLKIARWALALAHDRERIAEAQTLGLAVQLGGPVGALESLGDKGRAVRHRMATRLGLADALSWHVHRNAWVDLLDRVGQAVLTAGKIARDVSLLAQPEVGEMLEAPPQPGVGASSSMPHKRNPVACVHALAAATRMPGLLATLHAAGIAEHERALGGWQAELAVVPEIASALGSSLDFLGTIAQSLVVNAARMKSNLAEYGEAGTAPGDALQPAVDELLA
ncbi:MAG TPA: lyase family protein, partial [Usitatibacter sp.]